MRESVCVGQTLAKKVKLTEKACEALKHRLDNNELSEDDRTLLKQILDEHFPPKQAPKCPDKKKKSPAANSTEKRKGHGRLSEEDYVGARNIDCPSRQYKPGDRCPRCGKGNLFNFTIRKALTLLATAPIEAVRYLLEVLRCNTCGHTFEDPPEETRWGKHHPSANAGVVVMRYGLGVPGYRLQTWQAHMGVPLPDATQGDMIAKAGASMSPIFDHLNHLLAQSSSLAADDTGLKVLQLLKEFKTAKKDERHGCHATCLHGKHQGHQIVLYYVGRKHSGENIDELLQARSSKLPMPFQMGDGSACNTSHRHDTVEVFCHAHSFRKFIKAYDTNPELVDYLLHLYGQIFVNDRKTKGMTDQQRLEYHQQHSRPVMDKLRLFFNLLFEECIVENNSSLGQAISYVLKRWQGFSEFLCIPGVPLDNNETERLLKLAIRYRKNSGFFKTTKSARLGAMIMSILATTAACGANPMDYITQLQIHESEVRECPQLWLPWNYRDRMAQLAVA